MKILSKNLGRVWAIGAWTLLVALSGSVRADESGRGFAKLAPEASKVSVGGDITSTLAAPTAEQSGAQGAGEGSETDRWRYRWHYHYYYYRTAPVVYYYPVSYPVVYYRLTPYVVFRDGVDGAQQSVAERADADSHPQRD